MASANLYGGTEKAADDRKPKVNGLVKKYWREIERYQRSTRDWYEEGENIEKVYLDESSSSRTARKLALLWANTETLKPAVYTRTPTVMCSRRYRDRDPVARTAAELMERATNTTLELYGIDEVFRMVRDDRLLPGRGTAWVRYEALIDQVEEEAAVIDADGNEVIEIEVSEKLRSEKVCVDYVHWQDFGHNVARTWSEVTLVWRWVYLTEDEAAERFGSKMASRLTYNAKLPFDTSRADGEADNLVKVCEIWDKERGLVSWMADGIDDFLDSGEPPISFANFFPCPEPCYATKSSKGLIPKPDYCYYRDQAKEINDLTDKIGRLTEWLIVKGFIPGGPSSISDPLEELSRDKDNRELFMQVEDPAGWSDRGGASRLIDWFPIDQVIKTLQAAIQARAQLIQDVYQITGIADVLRGQSDPNETATAVDIRSQTGTRRLRNTKDDLARFCRDIARLTAEVIAEQFSPQSIADITGYKYIPPAPVMPVNAMMMGAPNMTNVTMFPGAQGPAPMGAAMPGMGHNGGPAMEDETEPGNTFDDRVIELLRNDRMRSFRVDIETDSTLQPDENAEKRLRMEFIEAAGSYLERAVKTVQAAPALANTMGEMLMFGLRGYRVGSGMEEVVDRDFRALVQQLKTAAAQPKPEDPVIVVAKTQVQGEIEKNRVNAALKAQEIQQDAALERRKQDLDFQVEIRDQNLDATAKARDAAARMMSRISRPGMANRMASSPNIAPTFAQPRQGVA